IRRAAKLGSRAVDVVFGGAPCQGFSLIGHRALDDPRNALVRDFVRIVVELKARYFVFENVKGLTVGRHRAFLQEIVEAFEDAEYVVRQPWRVLNAASYGVPQDRERMILFGARRGARLPDYPEPTSKGARGDYDTNELVSGPTCADALDDLPNAEEFSSLMETDVVTISRWPRPRSAYAKELRGL